jgi:hypothetical protein
MVSEQTRILLKERLNEPKMKEVLKRIIIELGIKFYELPHREALVMEVVGKYLKKKLRNKMESN